MSINMLPFSAMGRYTTNDRIYAQNERYVCILLEPEDWKVFKTMRLAQRSDEQDTQAFMHDVRAEGDYWQDILQNENEKIFCLFDGINPVGIAEVKIMEPDEDEEAPSALFTGAYRLSKIKGTGAGDVLHAARIHYVVYETDCFEAIARIPEDNTASRAAAQRNGFFEDEGNVFHLDVNALRQPKPAPGEHFTL